VAVFVSAGTAAVFVGLALWRFSSSGTAAICIFEMSARTFAEMGSVMGCEVGAFE